MRAHPLRAGRKPIAVQGAVTVAVALGFVLIGVVVWRAGGGRVVGVSAGAAWVAVVAFGISLWDVLAYAAGRRGWQPFWRWEIPAAVRRWLPPACLMVGIIAGHLWWH